MAGCAHDSHSDSRSGYLSGRGHGKGCDLHGTFYLLTDGWVSAIGVVIVGVATSLGVATGRGVTFMEHSVSLQMPAGCAHDSHSDSRSGYLSGRGHGEGCDLHGTFYPLTDGWVCAWRPLEW